MADFTSAELKMIHQGLILLKDKGPGWPVVSADAFARFRADLHCLQIKAEKEFRDVSYQEDESRKATADRSYYLLKSLNTGEVLSGGKTGEGAFTFESPEALERHRQAFRG